MLPRELIMAPPISIAAAITKKMLQKPLRHWKKRLGLQAWDIKIKLVEEISYGDPSTQAQCEVFLEQKQVTIIMCRVDDTPIRTLVHELIHVHGKPIEDVLDKNNETYLLEIHWEQLVETMAKALMDKEEELG